jgi:hypothetical protein
VHFTWEISAGQVIVSIPLLWIISQLAKMTSMLLKFRIEHETLMLDWAARQTPPVRLTDLPTRATKWW